MHGSPTRAPRVLIVDDCAANRALLGAILRHRNVIFREAEDGPTAISRCTEDEFDLVLMDIRMPGMSGVETTCELRSRWPDRPVSIVAVTAGLEELPLDELARAGFSGALNKPFSLADIDGLLGVTAQRLM